MVKAKEGQTELESEGLCGNSFFASKKETCLILKKKKSEAV